VIPPSVKAFVLAWRARLSSARAGVVLVYHRVGGRDGDEDVEILASVGGEAFEQELRHLRRRYRVVPAAEILDAARSRRRFQRFPVAITFDDDLASHTRNALPALRRTGLSATFFLGGASLQQPHAYWWEDLQRALDDRLVRPDGLPHLDAVGVQAALERTPRAILELTSAIVRLEPAKRGEVAAALRAAVGPPPADAGLRPGDVRALVEAGYTVGFHTVRHDALPTLSDDALASALRDGREELTAATGRPLELIAYPHGKADERVTAATLAAGFVYGFTTGRGVATPDTDPRRIPRTVADLSPSALALRLARLFAAARRAPAGEVSSAAPS
jgi:peptidoglycan/xylan/chitin deacetylase (PgdA/CDA1 family)